jgi:hypothetical protein
MAGTMTEGAPSLAQMPSTADTRPPPPGAWCRACHGTRFWTERNEPKGWRCMICHPPVHLRPDQIRREGEAVLDPMPRTETAADPLFKQAGIDLDER